MWCNLNADNYNNEIQIYSTFFGLPSTSNLFICFFFACLLACQPVCSFVCLFGVTNSWTHFTIMFRILWTFIQTGTVMIYLIFGRHHCRFRRRHCRRCHQFQFKLKCKLERGELMLCSILLCWMYNLLMLLKAEKRKKNSESSYLLLRQWKLAWNL